MTTLALQQGYLELLSRWRWDLFVTNTFRTELHPDKADRLWRCWISKMNRWLYGHRWEKRGLGLYWCRAQERQQRGVTHFHGLLGGPRALTLNRNDWEKEWLCMAGFADIETPRSSYAVQSYITKHLFKGAEIEFGGPLNRYAVCEARETYGLPHR